jgi:hypothetical protein
LADVSEVKATKVWNDFQQFATIHGDLGAVAAERMCMEFEQISISNHSKISNNMLDGKKTTRILFLTTKRSLLQLPDRWYFEFYQALHSQPRYQVIMWGTGMPGFSNNETTRENILRWFIYPNFDIVHTTWTYQRTLRGVEDEGSSKLTKSNMVRAREFLDLPGDPLVTAIVNELEMDHDEMLVQPHILFVTLEQQMGMTVHQSIDTCGNNVQYLKSLNKHSNISMNDCAVNPFLARLMEISPKTMIALLPNGLRVEKIFRNLNLSEPTTSAISNDINSSIAVISARVRRTNILLVGATFAPVYPLRYAGTFICLNLDQNFRLLSLNPFYSILICQDDGYAVFHSVYLF